ncbi:hypothetical protein ACB094_03G073500 [Castanea mollissima]
MLTRASYIGPFVNKDNAFGGGGGGGGGGWWRGRERKRALLFYNIKLCYSAYGAFSISYLAPECKIWLYEVHPCLMIFTSTTYGSPISLDCISSTNKVVASGQRAENTKAKLEK